MIRPVEANRLELAAFEIHERAAEELEAGARYYEERVGGLGTEFLAEVARTARYRRRTTSNRKPLGGRRRQVIVQRFPYKLIYRETVTGTPRLLAVAHMRGQPGYWRESR